MAVTRSIHRKQCLEPDVEWNVLPFAEGDVPDVEGARQGVAMKSRVLRRQDKVRGIQQVELVPEPECDNLVIIPGDVAELQKQYPSLAALFSNCVPESIEITDLVREVFLLNCIVVAGLETSWLFLRPVGCS